MHRDNRIRQSNLRIRRTLIWTALFLLIVPVKFTASEKTPGFMDNFRKMMDRPSNLIEFLLKGRLSSDLEAVKAVNPSWQHLKPLTEGLMR